MLRKEICGIAISQSTKSHILVQFLSIFHIVLMPFCLTWTYFPSTSSKSTPECSSRRIFVYLAFISPCRALWKKKKTHGQQLQVLSVVLWCHTLGTAEAQGWSLQNSKIVTYEVTSEANKALQSQFPSKWSSRQWDSARPCLVLEYKAAK